MAKTPTSARNSERGVALLEAVIALALVAMIASAGYAAFARAVDSAARAEARMAALAQAEMAIELASSPAFLVDALAAGGAALSGPGWRVEGAPQEGDGPLALIALTATAGEVTLETVRSVPR